MDGDHVAGISTQDDPSFVGQGRAIASSANIVRDRSPVLISNEERGLL
jgi:hypothetical protein